MNSDGSGFRPVRARRSFEDVVAQIREQISQGHLREGDRLPTERDLAATLGVSRNTVREALRALEHSGLLVQRPGVTGGAYISSSGATVIKTALDDLFRLGSIKASDLIEVRKLVGREVVRLACERYDDADFAALQDNFSQTELATAKGNLAVRVKHSLEFHKLLAKASRNPVLSIITDVLTDITLEFVKVIGVMPNEYVVESQRRLLDRLAHRDADGAVAEMEDYLRTTLDTYLTRA